jgi:hypothetical protein
VTAAGHDRSMAFTSVMVFATVGVVVPPPPPVLAAVWLVQAAVTRAIAKSVVTTRVLFTSVPLSFAPHPAVLLGLRLGEMLSPPAQAIVGDLCLPPPVGPWPGPPTS